MSLADLSAALQSLPNNPLFQMGTGMMAASGPSPVPVGLGQSLAGGMSYANQLAMKQAQADMMKAQFARFAWQNALLQKAFAQQGKSSGTQNPNYSGALAGSATNRAQDATNPQDQTQTYGSQGFTPGISATPTQIASQQFPSLSQGGAQAVGVQPTGSAPSGAPAGNGILGQILKTPAGLAAYAFNPEGVTNFAMGRQFPMPTPDMVNLSTAASLPSNSPERQAILGKYAVKTRNGAWIPGIGNYYSPNMPDGVVFKNPFDPSAGVVMPPGMTQAQYAMSAAKAYPEQAAKNAYAGSIAAQQEGARAAYTPVPYVVGGVPYWAPQSSVLGASVGGHPVQAALTPEQKAQGEGIGTYNAETVKNVQAGAESAQISNLGYQQALADAKTFQTGNFADYKGKALAMLNGLGIKVDPKALGSYQDMSKILTGAAMQTARTMGSREAAQIVTSIIKTASPNASLSPQGFAQVVSFMQAPLLAKQYENSALDTWRHQGLDISHFGPTWQAADMPAQILFSKLTPQQQHDFAQTNPGAIRAMRNGYLIAKKYGWTNLLEGGQ